MKTKQSLTASLMRGLATGRPILDPGTGELRLVDGSGEVQFAWHLEDLSPADLGYAFERVVGLALEERGYAVDYRGLRLKMLDGGIDLIAIAPSREVYFYQCKATSQSIGAQEIERILFKAGNFIAKQTFDPPCRLVLAVMDRSVLSAKAMHRWNRHNSSQNFVKLLVEEYPWRKTTPSAGRKVVAG